MRIILASASPRRRELLTQIGIEFEVIVSDVEEHVTATHPHEVVEELSAQKASAVLEGLQSEEEVLVIGADTVVSIDGIILGKPKDDADAASMLRRLSGRIHQVYTGVTMLYRRAGREADVIRKTFSEKTEVEFFEMLPEEIMEYISSGDCRDKAGSYGIQGFCARYIAGISGDYNNVVGLPVARLYQEGKEWLR
ncbi:MAG: Maf family protein [Acetatifactor sp.]